MGLMDMVSVFKQKLLARGRKIKAEGFLNENRNYFIQDDVDCVYYLKWDDKPWFRAGKEVPGIAGVGEAVNEHSFNLFLKIHDAKPCKKILFSWIEAHDSIYYLDMDEFLHIAKKHTQKFNGEDVLVVSLRSLKRL